MDIKERVILDLCGGTGAWSRPYREAGYDVRVIDVVDGYDVRLLEYTPAYGVLAAPPCTHLSSSGARWWKGKGDDALIESLSVVDACLRIICVAKPRWWALENPVGRLSRYIGKPVMTFNPCDYGDPWTKRTCLWGEFNLPEYDRVEPTEGSQIHTIPQIKGRAVLRSVTPPGFARAFFKANP